MPTEKHDLDVAISFKSEDASLANDIRGRLGKSLDTFVYTAKQEELAGTDGLETLRKVFRHRAKLVVILFRSGWGETPWTRVEMEAITDRFLKEGPGFLFVITLDSAAPPPWLPDKLLRFNLDDFGVEQAVGAIKARALEVGSVLHYPSSAERARLAAEEAEFGKERARLLRSEEGVQQATAAARDLFRLIAEGAKQAESAAPSLRMEYGLTEVEIGLRTPAVGLHVHYSNRITNVLDEARLYIREFAGTIILPGQSAYYLQEPKELTKEVFRPDISRAVGWGWIADDGAVRTSQDIADHCIRKFFALVDLHSAGKLPNP
jgi:hypothetical protein